MALLKSLKCNVNTTLNTRVSLVGLTTNLFRGKKTLTGRGDNSPATPKGVARQAGVEVGATRAYHCEYILRAGIFVAPMHLVQQVLSWHTDVTKKG